MLKCCNVPMRKVTDNRFYTTHVCFNCARKNIEHKPKGRGTRW